MTVSRVSRLTVFTLVSDEPAMPLMVEMVWRSDDPLAVLLFIHANNGIIDWEFSLDLLAAGLSNPTGQGDAVLAPLNGDLIEIALTSSNGRAVFHADRAVISDFLAEVSEHEPVDVGLALDCWLLGVVA